MSLARGLKEDACYTSLALGSKGRIRRSGIGVFPKRVACYTSLALGLKDSLCYISLARGLKRVFVCYMSLARGFMSNFVPYVPSTRVHESIPVRPAWLSKKEIFYGSVPVCPILLPKESLCENIQVCPAGFSKMI